VLPSTSNGRLESPELVIYQSASVMIVEFDVLSSRCMCVQRDSICLWKFTVIGKYRTGGAEMPPCAPVNVC